MVLNRFPDLLRTVHTVTEMLPRKPKSLPRTEERRGIGARIAVAYGAQWSVSAGGALRYHFFIQDGDLHDQSDPTVLHKRTGLLRQLFALEEITEQSVFFCLDRVFEHCTTTKIVFWSNHPLHSPFTLSFFGDSLLTSLSAHLVRRARPFSL